MANKFYLCVLSVRKTAMPINSMSFRSERNSIMVRWYRELFSSTIPYEQTKEPFLLDVPMFKNNCRAIFRTPYLVIVVLSFLFTSCSLFSHKKTETKAASAIVIYPSPPDTAHIQYLTRISYSTDIILEKKQNWFIKFLLGERKAEVRPIIKPSGITICKNKIYICDKTLGGLEIIDLKKNSFDYFIPTGKGALRKPLSCFIDTSGFLYVADPVRQQVVIFDKKGNYINCIGDTAKNFKPGDVFVYDNKIWVASMNGHKILVYSKDSSNKFLYSFPESEVGQKEFLYSPTNVCVANNKVYVTDFGDFKIKIFSTDGKFLGTLGNYGDKMGQLAKPKGIAVDSESIVYVVDAAFENVQMFSKEGKLLMAFGGPYIGPGDMWLPTKVTIDYDNLEYFQKFVDPSFELKYLIFVSNQFGPDKITVYGRVEPAKSGTKKTESESGNKRQKKKHKEIQKEKKP